MSISTKPIRTKLIDHALTTGRFERFAGHEPKSAPSRGHTGAIWTQRIRPVPAGSGLRDTTAIVTFWARIYGNALQAPEDEVDPALDDAAEALIAAYSADFTLGGLVRNIDLLGAHGEPLASQSGYLTIQSTLYRVQTVTVPCVVNDAYEQVP